MRLKDISVDFLSINHLLRVIIFHQWGESGGVGAEHNVACHYRTSGPNVQEQLFSTCDVNKALYHVPGAVDLLCERLPGNSKQIPVLASRQVGH